MKDVNHMTSSREKGFTLLELLLVIAIIVILSGTILVAVSSQRKRANEARALAELSGIMQSIVMCHSDELDVDPPDAGGGNEICDSNPEYGTWPVPPGSDFTGGYTSDPTGFNDGDWFFFIDDGSARICCNRLSSTCAQLDASASCNLLTNL